MSYLILVFGWSIYFCVHSILASDIIKKHVANKLPGLFKYYRLIYSVIALIGLIYLLLLNGAIKADNFFESSGIMRYLSLALAAFGVIIINQAFKHYRLSSFIGISDEEPQELVVSGLLSKIRHPLYSGTILITIAFFLFIPNLPTLLSALCILLYLPVGIWLEEKKLIKKFGQAYMEYKRQVPALIPKLK
jgi:methanethiol S-methyltransferase